MLSLSSGTKKWKYFFLLSKFSWNLFSIRLVSNFWFFELIKTQGRFKGCVQYGGSGKFSENCQRGYVTFWIDKGWSFGGFSVLAGGTRGVWDHFCGGCAPSVCNEKYDYRVNFGDHYCWFLAEAHWPRQTSKMNIFYLICLNRFWIRLYLAYTGLLGRKPISRTLQEGNVLVKCSYNNFNQFWILVCRNSSFGALIVNLLQFSHFSLCSFIAGF